MVKEKDYRDLQSDYYSLQHKYVNICQKVRDMQRHLPVETYSDDIQANAENIYHWLCDSESGMILKYFKKIFND